MSSVKPIRTIEVNGSERVVLQVSGCDYIRLEFPGVTVGIRCEDGVVYQYQEARPVVPPPMDDDFLDVLVEAAMATSNPIGVPTPDDVVEAAGGHFEDINQRYADMLDDPILVRNLSPELSRVSDLPSELDFDTDEEPMFEYHYGDTQPMYDETQLEETQLDN